MMKITSFNTHVGDGVYHATISVEVESLAAALKLVSVLQTSSNDPLTDATRPSGTPPTKAHRELEAVVAESGGELELTHAAGGVPIVVPRGTAPEGLPAGLEKSSTAKFLTIQPLTIQTSPFPEVAEASAKAVEEVAAPQKEKKPRGRPPKLPPKRMGMDPSKVRWPNEEEQPQPEPEPEAQPDIPQEATEAEHRASHAQRWNNKQVYNGVRINSVAVKGDYNIVLTLGNGEVVTLDELDNELDRKLAPAVSQAESVYGDFKPDYAKPHRAAEEDMEPAPTDIPEEVSKGPGISLKALLAPFIARNPDQTLDGARALLNDFNRCIQWSEHWSSQKNITDRAIRVLLTNGRINAEDAEVLFSEYKGNA